MAYSRLQFSNDAGESFDNIAHVRFGNGLKATKTKFTLQLDNTSQLTAYSEFFQITPQVISNAVFKNNKAPKIDDGIEIWRNTITPQSLGSKFSIFVNLYYANGWWDTIVVATYRNNTCIGLGFRNISGQDEYMPLYVYDKPETTSEIVYSIRVGSLGNAPIYINRTRDNPNAFSNMLQTNGVSMEEVI